MTTSETLNSSAVPPLPRDATEKPTPLAPSAVPPAQACPAEVLITEQQVMFSTAVAAVSRPENRLPAARARDVQRRMYYLERARMGREMDRL